MSLRTNSDSFSPDSSSASCSSGNRAQCCADAPDSDDEQAVARRNTLNGISVSKGMKRVVSKTFRSGNAELLKISKIAHGSKQRTKIRILKIGVVRRGRFDSQQRISN